MIIVQNALPVDLAEKMREEFIAAEFEQHYKSRPDYYKDKKEIYSCRYKRSEILETSETFHKCGNALLKILHRLKLLKDSAAVYAYKMEKGDYFRDHHHVTQGVSFILYLSKEWRWDWGGLLIVKEGGARTPVKPEFNNLVIVDDLDALHFVSAVAEYAREPRYTMIGFTRNTPYGPSA